MNQFRGLSPEESDNTEITDPKQYKRAEKKLRQKRERIDNCDCEKTKEKLSHEIRILEIEIGEYENRNKVFTKKEKTKSKPKVKEFVFDDDEIRKYNEKRKRENEEKAKKEYEERQKRKEKSSEHWKKWDQRSKSWEKEENSRGRSKQNYKWLPGQDEGEDDNKGVFDLKPFIEEYNMKLKDVPKDIMNLNHKFSLEDYKKLSRKYHPDKLSGKQDFMYILNGIRDHYIKREVKNDETWTK
uniref:J domain-containing protein n=1 Tax=viral metagenome TaxID=1070528 RepID=A0A6C0FB45_9ZZZZ|tara:strand:- start:495 stop:1217 length:723 start_codon:yes stop_codon:yes gene_type:complete